MGWKSMVTVGGKGVEGTVALGKKLQQQTNNNHLFYLAAFPPDLVLCVHWVISELGASTPAPLLPCLHVVAAAVCTVRWSLTSLYVYDAACWVTNQLPSFCWSNDETNFVTPFFFFFFSSKMSLCSLSLKCCKNTPAVDTEGAWCCWQSVWEVGFTWVRRRLNNATGVTTGPSATPFRKGFQQSVQCE